VSRDAAERLVLALLAVTVAAALAFVVVFATTADTQSLGIAGGVGLGALAGAAIVAGTRLLPGPVRTEERPRLEHREDNEEVVRTLAEGQEGLSRKGLLLGAAGLAGTSVGGAFAFTALGLGPGDPQDLGDAPWRAGVRLVDEEGAPLRPEAVNPKGFVTAFPEGADRRELGSPVVVVRVPPDRLRLPPERSGWAPEGIMAFSKICTHAGCAVSLFRAPNYPPAAPGYALVCPCHYSTFDATTGGDVTYGPAGRPLPQLPLRIDPSGVLVAGGAMSAPIGPSWWGVRLK
jgi:ubiquinol-cytochrome c reductase iron-sulfur subunit